RGRDGPPRRAAGNRSAGGPPVVCGETLGEAAAAGGAGDVGVPRSRRRPFPPRRGSHRSGKAKVSPSSIRPIAADASEADRQSEKRPVLNHVILEPACTRALYKVDAQRAVPQETGVGEAMVDAHLEAVRGEHIPRELAASVEATDVTTQQQLLAGRNLVPEP